MYNVVAVLTRFRCAPHVMILMMFALYLRSARACDLNCSLSYEDVQPSTDGSLVDVGQTFLRSAAVRVCLLLFWG